jgi:hypothetical protein
MSSRGGSSQGREASVPQTATPRPSGDSQLNLLGVPDLPDDLELGPVQREVMRFVRERGSITKDEAGALAHSHRDKHCVDERCAHCSIDGAPILRALVGRARLAKRPDGGAGLPEPVRGPGDLPAGF